MTVDSIGCKAIPAKASSLLCQFSRTVRHTAQRTVNIRIVSSFRLIMRCKGTNNNQETTNLSGKPSQNVFLPNNLVLSQCPFPNQKPPAVSDCPQSQAFSTLAMMSFTSSLMTQRPNFWQPRQPLQNWMFLPTRVLYCHCSLFFKCEGKDGANRMQKV